MAECASLRVSSPQSNLRYSSQGKREQLVHDSYCSPLAEQALAGGDNPTPLHPAMASLVTQGLTVPGARRYIPPSSGPDGSMALARERQDLDMVGLQPSVIAITQSARAISTQTLYAAKWRVFEACCDLF